MYFGLVITFFEADPYSIIIIQDKNGELVNLKVGFDEQ